MTITELIEKLNRLPQNLEIVSMSEEDGKDTEQLQNVDIVYVEKDANPIEIFWDEDDFSDISKTDPQFAATLRQVAVVWTT